MPQQSFRACTVTVKAAAALTGRRFVTTTGTVPAANAAVLGATIANAAIGDYVTCVTLGTAEVEAGAAIAAGATLATDSSGRAVTYASGVKIGTAMQAATAAGQIIEVNLIQAA